MHFLSTTLLAVTALASTVAAVKPNTCCHLTSFQQCGRDYKPFGGGSKDCNGGNGICVYPDSCDLSDPKTNCVGSCTACAAESDHPPPAGSPKGSCCSVKTDRKCGRDYRPPAGQTGSCKADEQCYYGSSCNLNDPKSNCIGTCWGCPPLA